jgi:hypothetical protein
MSAWLSDGTGGFRVVTGLRDLANLIPLLAELTDPLHNDVGLQRRDSLGSNVPGRKGSHARGFALAGRLMLDEVRSTPGHEGTVA